MKVKGLDDLILDKDGNEIHGERILLSTVIEAIRTTESRQKLIESLNLVNSEGKRLTSRQLFCNACFHRVPGMNLTEKDLLLRKRLHEKINGKETEVDLNKNEINLLKFNLVDMANKGMSLYVASVLLNSLEEC